MSELLSHYSFNMPVSPLTGLSHGQWNGLSTDLSVGEISDTLKFRTEKWDLEHEKRDTGGTATTTSHGTTKRFTSGEGQTKAALTARNATSQINFALNENFNLINIAQEVADTLTQQVKQTVSSVWDSVENKWNAGVNWIEDKWDATKDGISNLYNDAAQVLDEYIAEPVSNAVNRVSEGLVNLKDQAVSVTRDMYEGSWLESGVDSARQTLDNATRTVSNAYEGSWIDQKVDAAGESLSNVKDSTVEVASEAYEGSWLQSGVQSVRGFFSSDEQPQEPITGTSPADEVHGPAFEQNGPGLRASFSDAVTPSEEETIPAQQPPAPQVDTNPSMTTGI